MHEMATKYHEQAKKAGVLIVPACGFDSIPAGVRALSAYLITIYFNHYPPFKFGCFSLKRTPSRPAGVLCPQAVP